MIRESSEDFIRVYEKAANSGNFENVEPMIFDDAVFWFSDGSYRGLKSIREAFEKTWRTIKEEEYQIAMLEWIYKSHECAVCIYSFISKGKINGELVEFHGRGTNVLKVFENQWKIVHEHLSLEE